MDTGFGGITSPEHAPNGFVVTPDGWVRLSNHNVSYKWTGREWEQRRTTAKAGITGVWAVHGRSAVNFDEQVAMDLCGIYRRSTLGDMLVVLQTALIVVRGKGAG